MDDNKICAQEFMSMRYKDCIAIMYAYFNLENHPGNDMFIQDLFYRKDLKHLGDEITDKFYAMRRRGYIKSFRYKSKRVGFNLTDKGLSLING